MALPSPWPGLCASDGRCADDDAELDSEDLVLRLMSAKVQWSSPPWRNADWIKCNEWRRVECVLKDYDPGMRRAVVRVYVMDDIHFDRGSKLAFPMLSWGVTPGGDGRH